MSNLKDTKISFFLLTVKMAGSKFLTANQEDEEEDEPEEDEIEGEELEGEEIEEEPPPPPKKKVRVAEPEPEEEMDIKAQLAKIEKECYDKDV